MKYSKAAVAAAFTAMGILMLAIINFMFTPGYVWFYYPAFAALWVPMALFFSPRRGPVGFALVGSALTIAFLAAVNLQNSPEHPWFLYACYPFLWWPVVMYSGKKAGMLAFSLLCSTVTIVYYVALNVLVSPGYPWAIYPAFTILWWPMSLFFARRREFVGFAVAGGLWTIVFFAVVNLLSSPGVPWAIYPVFTVLWWPLTILCAKRKSWLGYSIAGTLLASAFFLAVNLTTSPGVLWAVFPIFAVLWWPLSVYFFKYRKRMLEQ